MEYSHLEIALLGRSVPSHYWYWILTAEKLIESSNFDRTLSYRKIHQNIFVVYFAFSHYELDYCSTTV